MKLIYKELPEVLKTVKLCEGIEFLVKEEINYLFVEKEGSVYGCRIQPLVTKWGWNVLDEQGSEYLGEVDLEGMDWRETLVRV